MKFWRWRGGATSEGKSLSSFDGLLSVEGKERDKRAGNGELEGGVGAELSEELLCLGIIRANIDINLKELIIHNHL